jgi:transitional endoplasmic reticulum ATPase
VPYAPVTRSGEPGRNTLTGVTSPPSDQPALTLTVSLRSATLDARRGVVRLHPEVLAALDLRAGDPVLLTAGNRTTAGLAAPAEENAARGLLLADDLMLGNLRTRDGATVRVSPAPVQAASTVSVAGDAGLVAVVSPEVLRLALLGKVVTEGDDVSLLPQDLERTDPHRPLIETARRSLANAVGSGWTSALLDVVAVEPAVAALITPDTVVRWAATAGGTVWGPAGRRRDASAVGGYRPTIDDSATGIAGVLRLDALRADINQPADTDDTAEWTVDAGITPAPTRPAPARPARRQEPSGGIAEISTEPGDRGDVRPRPVEDLAGLRSQAARLTELLELAFHHSEVLAKLGTTVRPGLLLSGPPGSGKNTLVRSVAAAAGVKVVTLWCPGLAALTPDAAAAALRSTAAELRTGEASLLLLTDVEALAPRESPGPLRTVLVQIIAELVSPEHEGRGQVAVVCTTSRPEEVDPSLRRPGVLDHELTVPLPDLAERRDLLALLTRAVPLAEDVALDAIAGITPGFVAADLATLVREAGVRAAIRQRDAEMPEVAQSDLEAARQAVRPTSMAESMLEVAQVSLDDVGDMKEVKEALTEVVLWPLRYPDTFARLGVDPPRGVLLYGPPGCGKTYLVKALAGTAAANILAVKGAELLTKWVGESERSVRELFRRAREAAPTLIFLDEIDALAPVRGQSTDGGTTDRVVAALLTELDGVEALRDVVVVGATNRPELIDPALLRPGRLERLVYVPPPDGEARTAILRSAAKRVPLSSDVDLKQAGSELDGYSSADCAALVREAALTAMRESMDTAEVTGAHLRKARDRVRPSLDAAQVAHLAGYADRREGR